MVSYYGKAITIDCGKDWLGEVDALRPRAIVVTHAHPDHTWGLKEGAPAPVYAPQDAWAGMTDFEIEERHVIEHRQPADTRIYPNIYPLHISRYMYSTSLVYYNDA